MNSASIQQTLRKADHRLIDELDQVEKAKAVHYFRMVYADQIGKMSQEVIRKRKVQQNLQNLMKQQMELKEETEEAIRNRMKLYQHNREKNQESKSKEHIKFEQNWQRKWGEIARKKKREAQNMQEKAEKVRKETEEYWSNKEKAERERQRSLVEKKHTLKQEFQMGSMHTSFRMMDCSQPILEEGPMKKSHHQEGKKTPSNTVTSKLTSQLPVFRQTHFEKHRRSQPINKTIDIIGHQHRSIQAAKEKQQQTLKSVMDKLKKIEQSRHFAQERIEKEVEQARKERQRRQNPELLARNRQRSIDYLQGRSRRNTNRRETGRESFRKEGLSVGKSRLQQSLSEHIQNKRRISELEFAQREEAWQARARRVKQSKLQRVIKEAVAHLRQEGQRQ